MVTTAAEQSTDSRMSLVFTMSVLYVIMYALLHRHVEETSRTRCLCGTLAGVTSSCPGKRTSYRQSHPHDVVREGRKEKKWFFLEEPAIVTPVVTELKFHINGSVEDVHSEWVSAAKGEIGRSHNLLEQDRKRQAGKQQQPQQSRREGRKEMWLEKLRAAQTKNAYCVTTAMMHMETQYHAARRTKQKMQSP